MSSGKEGNEGRKWVGSQLSEATHTALNMLSTMMGLHPSMVVEMAVEAYIVEKVRERQQNGLEVKGLVAVQALYLEDRARLMGHTQLVQLALSWKEWPTDEALESLMRVCDKMGMPFEQLMNQIDEKMSLVELPGERKLDQVAIWLSNQMQPGKKYSSTGIMRLANAAGYKEHAIKAAKRAIGVTSVREEKEWVWVRNVEGQKESETDKQEK